MVKEKRQIGTVLLKFGVALSLSLSLGGILYSVLRTKRIRPSDQSPLPPPPPQGGGKALMENDHDALGTTSFSSDSASIAPDKDEEESRIHKASSGSSISDLSAATSKYSGEKDELLLPELYEHVKGFDSDIETSTTFKRAEEDEYEQEITNLKNMVRILREREKTLEIQLLDYFGLKEQETAVIELQNRLKITNKEAKLYRMKIQYLEADNRMLESQIADYPKVVAELRMARGEIKLLKKRLESETEHNKEQILNLQQRVEKLLIDERETIANDQDDRFKPQRLKDLEGGSQRD